MMEFHTMRALLWGYQLWVAKEGFRHVKGFEVDIIRYRTGWRPHPYDVVWYTCGFPTNHGRYPRP